MNDRGPRVGRHRLWDHWRRGGTGGDDSGTSGGLIAALVPAYLAVALFIGVVNSVNVLSELDEAARDGRNLAVWIPVAKELSSAIGVMLACGLAHLALRLARPGRAVWALVALVQVLGSIAFSGAHQTVMTWLRVVIFAAHGRTYHRPPLPADLLYEYRKDMVGYAIIVGLFWLFRSPELRAPAPSQTPLPTSDATFDIIDGTRTLRVPVGWIMAVRSAGNYVEFVLQDGRRPLMRASLATVEAALASQGLVRTHRSWLVNPNHLRSLEATGSGDYRLGLDRDLNVPLSRRFRPTLDRLRRGEQAVEAPRGSDG
ncbi:MAG TPA: LytTR family DNA-binding domain-containing protein [Caulobacter sp.]|nr:LytTR family DNA-binding domain-containing protein [Caulobacter sp.]